MKSKQLPKNISLQDGSIAGMPISYWKRVKSSSPSPLMKEAPRAEVFTNRLSETELENIVKSFEFAYKYGHFNFLDWLAKAMPKLHPLDILEIFESAPKINQKSLLSMLPPLPLEGSSEAWELFYKAHIPVYAHLLHENRAVIEVWDSRGISLSEQFARIIFSPNTSYPETQMMANDFIARLKEPGLAELLKAALYSPSIRTGIAAIPLISKISDGTFKSQLLSQAENKVRGALDPRQLARESLKFYYESIPEAMVEEDAKRMFHLITCFRAVPLIKLLPISARPALYRIARQRANDMLDNLSNLESSTTDSAMCRVISAYEKYASSELPEKYKPKGIDTYLDLALSVYR